MRAPMIIVTTNFVQLDSTKIDNYCIEIIRMFFLLINFSQKCLYTNTTHTYDRKNENNIKNVTSIYEIHVQRGNSNLNRSKIRMMTW